MREETQSFNFLLQIHMVRLLFIDLKIGPPPKKEPPKSGTSSVA